MTNHYADGPVEASPGEQVMRARYRQLEPAEIAHLDEIKGAAARLYDIISSSPPTREQSVSKTKLEESVMWAVKGLTR